MSINICHEFGILVNIGFVFSKSNILSLNKKIYKVKKQGRGKKEDKRMKYNEAQTFTKQKKHNFLSFLKIKVQNLIISFFYFLLWAQNAKDLVLGGFSPHPMPPPSSFFFFLIKADLQSTSPSFPGNFVTEHNAKLLFEFPSLIMGHIEQAYPTSTWHNLPECNLPDPWEKSRLASQVQKQKGKQNKSCVCGSGSCKVSHCSFLLLRNYSSIVSPLV